MNEKIKNRWYQYNLRTLLLVVVLASVALSWYAVKLRRARLMKEAERSRESISARIKANLPLARKVIDDFNASHEEGRLKPDIVTRLPLEWDSQKKRVLAKYGLFFFDDSSKWAPFGYILSFAYDNGEWTFSDGEFIVCRGEFLDPRSSHFSSLSYDPKKDGIHKKYVCVLFSPETHR